MRPDKWKTYDEFVDMLPVSRHALDELLERQADTYHRIAEMHTEALAEAAEAKELLVTEEARLTIAAKAGAEKVTEAVAKALVAEHPDRARAWKAMQQAKVDADRWGTLLESWRQRGFSMTNLGNLYAAGYFQPTSAGRQAQERRYEGDREALARSRESRGDRAAAAALESARDLQAPARRTPAEEAAALAADRPSRRRPE